MKPLSSILARSLTLGTLLLVSGCGSGTQSTNTISPTSTGGRASVAVTIHWPTSTRGASSRTRLIPIATQSIQLAIKNQTGVIGSATVNRPTTGDTTTITIPEIPLGTYTETATAYPGADASGTAQAQGIQTIKVDKVGTVTTPDLTMNTTIVSVIISPASPALLAGGSVTLTATAKDKDGNVVLVTPSKFGWATNHSEWLGLTLNGATAVGLARAAGTAYVIATETESGIASAPLAVTITAPPANTGTQNIVLTDVKRLIGLNSLPTPSFQAYDDSISGTSFYYPQSVALDGQGRIYIADYPRRIVRIDDFTGANRVTYVPTGSSASAIHVDRTGRIYYRNSEGTLSRMDDMSGTNKVSFGSSIGANSLGNISGIANDSQGRIYVFDGYSQVIRIDDMTGANLVRFGTRGSGANQFSGNYRNGLAIDNQDRIYVADVENHRLVRFDDMTGANWTVYAVPAGAQAALPLSIAIESGGSHRIYFTDLANAKLYRMDDFAGTNLVSYGENGTGTGQFDSLSSLAVK